jgi:hypothetical protein
LNRIEPTSTCITLPPRVEQRERGSGILARNRFRDFHARVSDWITSFDDRIATTEECTGKLLTNVSNEIERVPTPSPDIKATYLAWSFPDTGPRVLHEAYVHCAATDRQRVQSQTVMNSLGPNSSWTDSGKSAPDAIVQYGPCVGSVVPGILYLSYPLERHIRRRRNLSAAIQLHLRIQ